MPKPDKIYIKPKDGMTIPHPKFPNIDIGPDGCSVPNSSFYRRFIARGEAEKAKPPKPATAPKKTTQKPEA